MITKEKIYLGIGMFVLIASIGITYTIAEGDNAYFCEVENSVGLCFKLSKVNDAGLQTRCYYNQDTPTRYNYCKSGWFEYKDPTVTGELVKVNDNLRIENIGDKYIFWKKERVETKESLIKELDEILFKLDRLNVDKETWTKEYYGFCLDSCPFDCEIRKEILEKEYNSFCQTDCQADIEFALSGINSEIIKLNEEKEIIQEVIK